MNDNLISSTIDGKFHVVSLLGAGGLGSVYKATQPELNRQVAIKIMHGQTGADDEHRQRFEREARILSSLSHEHIVGVYSFGVLPDGYPYMAMEYLEGRSLAQVISDETKLSWQRTARIGVQICQALAAAHKAGVVHRDLKPQNVMLVEHQVADFVKVLDFGLSKLLPDAEVRAQKLTQTGAIVGTFHYMSPELCNGLPAGEKTDIYSLGCTLYECVTGVKPFDSDQPIAILHKHQAEMPEAFSSAAPAADIPQELEYLIFKAMQKDPQDRFTSMEEFEEALRLVLTGRASELSMSAISMGQKKTNKQSPVFVYFSAGCLFVALATLVLVKMSVSSSDHRRDSGKSPVKAAVRTHTNPIINSRLVELERAQRLAWEARFYANSHREKQAELSVQRAIKTIGHAYPGPALNDDECQKKDLAVLEQLATTCMQLGKAAPADLADPLHHILRNNTTMKADERARLLIAEGRLYGTFGDPARAAEQYYYAIRTVIQVPTGQMSLAHDLLKEAEELSAKAVREKRLVDMYVLVARVELLGAEGQCDEMMKLDNQCHSELESCSRDVARLHSIYDMLESLLYLEQKCGHLDRAMKTLKQANDLSLAMTEAFPEVAIAEKTGGNYRPGAHFNDAIARLEALLPRLNAPVLKSEAQRCVAELRKKKAAEVATSK